MYQYFEDAIEHENRDLKTKTLFPSRSTFLGRRWDNWDKNDRERTIEGAESRLVITHNDADGLTSGALFVDHFGWDNVDVLSIDYENIQHVFKYISDHLDGISEIYVSDLNLDEVYEEIDLVANVVDEFVWIDHHEWGDTKDSIREFGVDVRINQDRAAAGLVLEYLVGEHDYTPSDNVLETVQLTEDHDLWNHEMQNIMLGSYEVCISEAFSQVAFYSDTDTYLQEIFDYGMEFMDHEEELLRGDKGAGFIAQKESEHHMKIEYILDNETEVEEIGGYTVGFAYGRASPGVLLEELSESDDVDILVHTKPQYPVKASIRSTDAFHECHKIAERLDGGGHDQAAGCKPEDVAQEPLEFVKYVHNHGEQLQNLIKQELTEYLEEES